MTWFVEELVMSNLAMRLDEVIVDGVDSTVGHTWKRVMTR